MHFKKCVRACVRVCARACVCATHVTLNGLENCVLSTENPDNYSEILYPRVSFHH